jgi:hypothetical protein
MVKRLAKKVEILIDISSGAPLLVARECPKGG